MVCRSGDRCCCCGSRGTFLPPPCGTTHQPLCCCCDCCNTATVSGGAAAVVVWQLLLRDIGIAPAATTAIAVAPRCGILTVVLVVVGNAADAAVRRGSGRGRCRRRRMGALHGEGDIEIRGLGWCIVISIVISIIHESILMRFKRTVFLPRNSSRSSSRRTTSCVVTCPKGRTILLSFPQESSSGARRNCVFVARSSHCRRGGNGRVGTDTRNGEVGRRLNGPTGLVK